MMGTQTWRRRFRLLSLLLLACAFACPAALGAREEIRDSANNFDPATLAQANSIIRQIKQECGKDLTIETFEGVPDHEKARFAALSKDDFYEHWMREEANLAKTDGVFILIVNDPGRLQIGVGNHTRIKAFTDKDRDELRDAMVAKFRDKQFDAGLLEGAKFVLQRMEEDLGVAAKHVDPSSTAPAATADLPATAPAPTTTPATAPATQPATEVH